MLAIVGLGMVIARQITSPLEELVAATNDVTGGNLRRRSNVKTDDEIGTLSRSFNRMTEHLLRLYGRVLSESGQRAAIVDSIADGIVVCDPAGNIRVMNRAMRSLLNLHGDANSPARFSDLPLVPLSHDEGAFGYEQTNLLYTIGDRVVRISDARVTAVDGTYLGEVYVLQDLTAEFNIDRAKTEFIGTISHELRSPITTLRMTAELLTRGMFGELDERQISAIDTMQYKLVGMTELINNVIIIASIDSGLALEIEPVDTREIIEDSVAKLRRGISEKGLTLTLDIPDDLPPVLIDYDHFPTILRQLVENARLYTDEGGIAISAARDGEFVRIDVSDTGCGIDPDMTEQVFERFVRGTGAGQGIDSQERGIGLGLAIVKQLVQRHGGQVWVSSTPGEGSVFSFTIRHADDLEGSHKSGSSLTSAA
jgi:signal transduction histidine kinase/HAMP domain-containing protein